MKKLFNKKAFALVLCLVLALTAMMTVTAFADTEPADGAAVSETAETAADSVTGTKAMASAIAIGIAAAAGKQTGDHRKCQDHCQDLFHFRSS